MFLIPLVLSMCEEDHRLLAEQWLANLRRVAESKITSDRTCAPCDERQFVGPQRMPPTNEVER